MTAHPGGAMPAGTVVLFDIDGTIIRAGDPAHRDAFERAMREVHDVDATLDGITLGGRLDRQIARDALAAADVDPAQVDARLTLLLERVGDHYRDAVAEDARRSWLLPGVAEAAQALLDADAAVGVLTGGQRTVARHKLAAAGVESLFAFGAYGCEADHRHLLVEHARADAEARGLTVGRGPVVIVGDTPLDVAAAHEAGARCLAVATGRWSAEDLAAAGADLVLDDLAAPPGGPLGPFLELVGGDEPGR